MEFKILGGTSPASSSLGNMTQGLGFPLHPVEPAVSGGDVTVITEEVFNSANFDDQNPVGLGIDYQVLFGGVSATPEFSVDALGNITCLDADQYNVIFRLTLGREGTSQVSQLYMRILLNGVARDFPTHTILDSDRIEIPSVMGGVMDLAVSDILTLELVRDTDGANQGGLRAGVPDVAWDNSPSAQIIITRAIALVTVI